MVQLVSVLAVSCSFVLTTQRAEALPRTHDGFYLQLDAGLGYLSSSAEFAGSKVTYSGVTIPTSLLLGGTVGPVVIGGGFITDYAASPSISSGGTSTQLSDVSLYLYSMGVFADIYPDPHGGLHFQPYLGWGGLQASYQGYTGNSATGMVLALGGGYDWWVADEWSIGIMGRLTYAPLSLNGVGYSTIAPAILASFTYH
jgi:hypothetical protein